ncbi:MAG: hypothetical protein V3U68_00005, partial [Bacteroidota bacterium]
LERLRKTRPRSGLASFLLGRVLHHQGEFNRSQEVLTQNSESLSHPFLKYLSAYTQGLNLYYLGQFQPAKILFWNSLNFRRSMYYQSTVDDWIERCDWMSEFGGRYLDSQ